MVESRSPGFPFQPGQIIELPRPTKEMFGWIKRGWVEVLKEEPERAVVHDTNEHAVIGRK
jgi:hypothetical protein